MADRKLDEYKNVKFYAENSKAKQAGFSRFKDGEDFYFCRYIDGKIAMISQAYTSAPGRDNGIESVKKNEKLVKRYVFETRAPQAHGFGLKAGNGQEIAISPDYASLAQAEKVSGRLTGGVKASKSAQKKVASKTTIAKPKAKKSAPKKATLKKAATAVAAVAAFSPNDPRTENYKPLAFYKNHGGNAEGFNSFEKNGAHYFHYNEAGEIVLISESYTSKSGRDNGIASVKKNLKRKAAYQHHQHKNGNHYFDINAGNHQEIATSRWYGSAAAATAGAAYLLGTRRRVTSKTAKPAGAALAAGVVATSAASAKAKPVKKTAAPKTKPVKKAAKPAGAALAAGVVATSAASAKAKPVKKTAAPKTKPVKKAVKPAAAALAAGSVAAVAGAKPAPAKTKPVKKKTKPTLAAGSVAVAALGASAAAAKVNAVKKAAVPVKAGPMKPVPVAAPIAAAAVGTAAVAGAAAIAAAPKAKPVVAAPVSVATAPIAAAATAKPIAAASAPVAVAGGGGIWGWLKWVLMTLIALFAILFLMKSCVGGDTDGKAASAVTTTETATPAAIVTCWNGSKANTDQACPTKVTCWDDSFATSLSTCPVKLVAKDFDCWDGSKAVDLAGCPSKVVAAAKTTAGTMISSAATQTGVANATAGGTNGKMSAPSVLDRICAPSSNPLFDVSTSTPVSVGRLGTNPQFGNSLTYTPDEFFRRLQVKYRTSPRDKSFLDLMAKSLGYGKFANMDASMFSNDTLAKGTSGLLGFGSYHALQFSALNVSDSTHLEAFKVQSVNGTDVHFMKRCGNFMYVCQP